MTASGRSRDSDAEEFVLSVTHGVPPRANAGCTASGIAGTSPPVPSIHSTSARALPAMNLLTTCLLSGALATSFLARPVVPSPTVEPLPSAEPTAQDSDEALASKKYENPSWSRVTRIAFFPGKEGAAIDLIQNHFRPATKASGGTEPHVFQHATGRWNLTAIWNLPEGTASLDWEVSPETVAWRKALAEQLGSADQAEEMVKTYRSYVRDYQVDLVRTLESKPMRPVEASSRK